MEMARRRGRRRKKLLDGLKDRRGYSHLKEEALDCTMWRNRFGGGFGPVIMLNEWNKIHTPGNRPKERIQQSTDILMFMHIGLMYFHLFFFISHFNTIVSNFCDWFRWMRMGPHGWWVSFFHSCYSTYQFQLSLALSFVKWDWWA